MVRRLIPPTPLTPCLSRAPVPPALLTAPPSRQLVGAMATEQPDALVLGAEVLLAEAAQVQMRCWEQSAQLSAAAAQLRHQSQALREQCGAALVDMAELRGKLEELLDTKVAFEARERQARKLSKQL